MTHFISLQEAIDMTTLYRSQRENILKTNFQNQSILPLSETYDKLPFATIMAKQGCTGLRIYYGMTEDLKVHAIIVGVNAEGEDMLPPENAILETDEEDIIERGNRCPDICPPESPLNS
jgi:hypothetical protein